MINSMLRQFCIRKFCRPSAAIFVLFAWVSTAMAQSADPLPSWANGSTKQAITSFVEGVTTVGDIDYVPPNERIAVFDNDGTLYSERPWVQGYFIQQLLKDVGERNPTLRNQQPYKAALARDRAFFAEGGMREYQAAVRSAMTELPRDEFDAAVRNFFANARHPVFDVPFQQTIYQPALELLDYLRSNGFRTFICSGGGLDFMRAISKEFYGIETYEVIGTSYKKELLVADNDWTLTSTSELSNFNNKDQKAINIDLHIGQRPLLVMGNAGGKGDIGMMGYSQGRDGPSLQLMIDHNDETREFAYAEDDNESLKTAQENGWVIVSIKDDWATVYPSSD